MDLIQAALKEDMPHGDLTTESLAIGPRFGYARLSAKQDLVLSGTTQFEETLLVLDPNARLKWHFSESEKVLSGQTVCTITGDLTQILKAERVALNFISRLSGIATLTRKFVDQVAHTATKIIDTRKTLPGYRELEKRAVAHGQGLNHRFSLSEAIAVKANHIVLASGLSQAVERIRQRTKLAIEVEVRTLEEVEQAVAAQVSCILLDEMDNDTMARALKMIPETIRTKASGNMTLERVRSIAEMGLSFISVGAITQSAPSAEMTLLFDWQGSRSEGVSR